jgi:hypothetical protein
MKLNETVLWVEESGEVNLCASKGRDIRHWRILCPFKSEDIQCGSWCPLFEVEEEDPGDPTVRAIYLHCGKGRRYIDLPIVEEVKP